MNIHPIISMHVHLQVPKIIIILGLTLAVWTVLLYPLDIANAKACASNFSPTACTYTLPTETMWYACFIAILAMSFAVIPFTLFYYEADSDFNLWQKIKSALAYTLVLAVVVGLLIGILYGE
jgi:LMBR1 domain-containing protein 1